MAFLTLIKNLFQKVIFKFKKNKKTILTPNQEFNDHNLVLSVTKPSFLPKFRQIKYIKHILNYNEARLLSISIFLSIIFLGTSITLLLFLNLEPIPNYGGTYKEGLIGDLQGINPLDSTNNPTDNDLVHLIYSGLFKLQGDKAIPDLAESYQWIEPGKILQVKLKKDITFHNKLPITADDIQFTIDLIQNPLRNSTLQPLFAGVTVEIKDPQTSIFKLPSPNIQFPKSLTVGILPAQLWQNVPITNAKLANLNFKPIGSGPYLVKSFTKDTNGRIYSYELEAYSGYYGKKPYIKNINFQFFPDKQSAQNALKSDLIDGLAFLSANESKNFQSTKRWHNISIKTPQEMIAFFNLKNELLSNQKIRQALIKSISKTEISKTLNNQAQIINGPYPFLTTSSTKDKYNLNEAKKILDEEGWKINQNDNIRYHKIKNSTSTKSLQLTILTPNQEDLLKVANNLKRQWSLLGAKVTIESDNLTNILKKSTRDRNHQIVLLNILLDQEQDLYPIWWSGEIKDRGTNLSNLSDKKIDDYIEKTRNATSSQNLIQAQQQLSQEILKHDPAIFLVRPQYSYILSTRVKGIPQSIKILHPAERFTDFNQWYIKTWWKWKQK